MDITWYGMSCFRISERSRTTIITDPYQDGIGLPPLRLKGDVVTVSHSSPGHNFVDAVKGRNYVLQGPGEYEIGGVFVTGLATFSPEGARNVAYLFEYDELNVLHLGDLAQIPEQSLFDRQIHVALVPVGGGNSLRAAQAAELIAMLEPSYVVPMHYALPGLEFELDPLDRFLKAMGVSEVQEEDLLRVNASSLPEQSQVIVLRPQG